MQKIWLFFFLSTFLFNCTRPQLPNTPMPTNLSASRSNINTKTYDCSYKFTKINLCLNWRWDTLPSGSDYGSMIIRTYTLSSLDGFPVLESSPYNLKLELYMPSMNHGSNPTQTTQLTSDTYKIEDIFFIHAGHWEFRFYLINPESNHVFDTLTVPYSF